jgi:hypothetical protein
MKYLILILTATGLNILSADAQVVNICTNPAAQQVMLGAYDPAAYMATTVINDPTTISTGINASVSPDSLHAYINAINSCQTRNSGSDTVSAVRGIGAARRWVYNKFRQFSAQNENRLLPGYLQFDTTICGVMQHRNILAVLPGTDTSDKSIIVIEGHIDSRCAGLCDTSCIAMGTDDNGSGTALVIELARVMSKYSYNHTIVFLVTIGEEQGLFGAQAFAVYAQAHGIQIKAVMNNDVVGGIICGHTSSAPSCPGYDVIDSTDVRLFSQGTFNSFHKGLCRYIKLEYKEMISHIASVPMTINIMTPVDRAGRGGDHEPFNTLGYVAMRFTEMNENGDANVTSGTYTDRQHTSSDSIGVDINSDGTIDTFFVDFNYLARNTVINANAASMMGISPKTPDFTLSTSGANLIINITQHQEYLNYRIGVRTTSFDWDSVYTFTGPGSLTDTIVGLASANYYVSVASVDSKGVESLFSRELNQGVNSVNTVTAAPKAIELLQNKPNPADEATVISVLVNEKISYKEAYISIRDLNGKEVHRERITLDSGMNEVVYSHGYHMAGTFIYSLIIDGTPVQSRRMVFAN